MRRSFTCFIASAILDPICSSVHPPLRSCIVCNQTYQSYQDGPLFVIYFHMKVMHGCKLTCQHVPSLALPPQRCIPGRRRDPAAPFLPGPSLVKQAGELDVAGGQDHSLGEPPPQEDCCSYRGASPRDWKHTAALTSCPCSLFGYWLSRPKRSLPTWRSEDRKVYLPGALCFRWQGICWQKVSRGDTGVLVDAVSPLRPKHLLHVLWQKHIWNSLSFGHQMTNFSPRKRRWGVAGRSSYIEATTSNNRLAFPVLPVSSPDGCPRGQQQGPGPRRQKDAAEEWLSSGLSCVLTQVPRWLPLIVLLQTLNEWKKNKCDIGLFSPEQPSLWSKIKDEWKQLSAKL